MAHFLGLAEETVAAAWPEVVHFDGSVAGSRMAPVTPALHSL